MGNYILSCGSTADLSRQHFERRGISYICYPYELDGKPYKDDLGQTVPYDHFYAAMTAGAETKTAHINAYEFEEYFEPFLKNGNDVLHLCLSSGITSVMTSARIAKENLEEKYPGHRIYLVDSLAASSGCGLLMDTLADLRDSGMDIDALHEWGEENKLKVHHWFFSTDLSFYIKGGRISKAAATVGQMLGICPLLNINTEGKLILKGKIRSKKRVIHTLVDKMEAYADDGLNYNGKCYISHSGCFEDARQVADLVESRFSNLNGPVEINDIGTTIGSHTGPGTVALFFWGKPRSV